MVIRIPKRLKVGGRDYEIVYPYVFTELTNQTGQCCSESGKIKLGKTRSITNEEYSEDSICVTFLHEVLHAIDLAYLSGKLEEEQISVLSEGLYQVLKDNDIVNCRCKKCSKKEG